MSLYDEYQKQQNNQGGSLYDQYIKSTGSSSSNNPNPTPSQQAATQNKQSNVLDTVSGFFSNLFSTVTKGAESLFSKFQSQPETPKLTQDQVNKIDTTQKQTKPPLTLINEQTAGSSANIQPIQTTTKNIFDTSAYPPGTTFISQAPPKQSNVISDLLDKGGQLWNNIFGINEQADTVARAQNAYQLLKQKPELNKVTNLIKLNEQGGNPFKNSDFETYGAQAMRDAGVLTQPSNAEFTNLMMALSLPVSLAAGAAGLAPSVTKQLVGLGAWTAVQTTFTKGLQALTGKSNLSEFLPSDTPVPIKTAVDALEILGTAYATHGIFKKAPDIKDFFTKTTVEKYNLPQEITITSTQLRDIHQTGTLTTAEEKDFIAKAFAGRSQEYSDAIKNNSDITITPERIVDIVDRPYWAKIKAILKKSPSAPISKTIPGSITFSSDTLKNNVINSDLKDTPVGQKLLTAASEAEKQNKDIKIVPNGGTPVGTTPGGLGLGYQLVDKQSIELISENGKPSTQPSAPAAPILVSLQAEAVSPIYSSAESFAQQKLGTGVGSLIGTIDPQKITARDPIDQGTVNDYKTRIQAGEAIDPVVAREENGQLITTDGSQRITAYQQLGKPAPIIVTKFTNPIPGLQTIGDFYRQAKTQGTQNNVPSNQPIPVTQSDVTQNSGSSNQPAVIPQQSTELSTQKDALQFLYDFWKGSDPTAFTPERLSAVGTTPEKVQKLLTDAVSAGVPENFILDRSKYTATNIAIQDIKDEIAKLKSEPKQAETTTQTQKTTPEKGAKTAQIEATSTLAPSKASKPEEVLAESGKLDIQGTVHLDRWSGKKFGTYQRPPIGKIELKTILDNAPEFAANPVLTVNKDQNLEFIGKKVKFTLNPEGLQIKKENLKVGEKIKLDIQALKEKGAQNQMRVSNSSGVYADNSPYAPLENRTKAAEARLRDIKIIEMPEMVKLARELSGKIPEVVKKLRGARGRFYAQPLDPLIKLDASIFEDPEGAAKTLAHEIGHLVDFLPDRNMARGNVVGRITSLHKHLKNLYGELDNKVVKKELINLGQVWKPFDPAADPAFTKYRTSPAELYADAISVLFNDPVLLQDIAPTFYKGFFDFLDRKPEVKQEFFDLQDLLNKGEEAVLSEREQSIREMFKKGEDLFKVKVEEQKLKEKDYGFRLKYELIDQNQKVIDLVNRAKKEGKPVSDEDNPVYWLEGHNYVGGIVKNWIETSIQPIYQRIGDAGITWEDFGEILFLERVLNDRSKLANPLGFTPKTAGEQLDFLKKQLGEDKYKIIQEELPKYREAIKKIMESDGAKEFYNPELLDSIKKNPTYATYQVLDYFDTNLPASIKHQVGTLKEISNPATSTIVKTISIIRAIERNQTKGKIVKFLKTNFAKEIEPAKTIWNGKSHIPVDPTERGQALFTVMEQGKYTGYYVDPYIASTMERMTIGHSNAVIETFKFFNSKAFRPLFITFNLGFQSFNFARDFMRAYKNLPTYNILSVINEYRKAVPAAYARAFELPNKTIQEMEKAKILNVTFNDLIAGQSEEDKQIDSVLNKYGLSPLETTKINKFIRPFEKVLDLIKRSGDFIETLPKVAGYNMLNGKLPNQELASYIRTSVGSPDFMRKGAGYRWYNEVFLFSNAIKEGVRADFSVAFKNPRTRSGFWWKSAILNFLPKLLMFAAAIGIFGNKLKQMMDNVSEYDKTNYTTIPLSMDGGKTVYLRIPQDETGRLYGGLLWKALNITQNTQNIGQNLADIFATAGGQIPNISPLITSVSALAQFMAGQNPYDFFHGQNVIPDTQFKAGGMYALKPFVMWELQNLGLGTIMKTTITEQAPTNKQWYQKVLDAPVISNIFGRWIKVSDYGQKEDNQKIQAQQQSVAAQKTLQQKELINQYLKEWQSSDKSQTKKMELINRFSQQVASQEPADNKQRARTLAKTKMKLALDTGEYGANTDSIINATSNATKVQILQKVQSEMAADEFIKYRGFLLKEGIISEAVISQLRKSK